MQYAQFTWIRMIGKYVNMKQRSNAHIAGKQTYTQAVNYSMMERNSNAGIAENGSDYTVNLDEKRRRINKEKENE